MRIDESRPREVQPHHLHKHLVRIGGAVEGAGAGAVIGGHLGFQEILAACLATCKRLADRRFFVIRQAACHRACRHEYHRQMAKGQRADHESRHDLVADTEAQRRVINAV